MTRFDDATLAQLRAPLSPLVVKERSGRGGQKFSYLEAHYVTRRLNELFGFDGWSIETRSNEEVSVNTYKTGNGLKVEVLYRAVVRLYIHMPDGSGFFREGTGFGSGDQYLDKDGKGSHASAAELAMKESESDAKKRAAMSLGDQFGLALYDKERTHVADQAPTGSEIDKEDVRRIKEAPTVEAIAALLRAVPSGLRSLYLPYASERKRELTAGGPS